jgi:hypothetical protein
MESGINRPELVNQEGFTLLLVKLSLQKKGNVVVTFTLMVEE